MRNASNEEALKAIKSESSTILPNQIDDDIKSRIRSLYKLKVKNNYCEYTPHCRFKTILCPSETAINYPKLHANKISINEMHFIAMQYPTTLQTQYFWNLCLENNSVIFDLTNISDTNNNWLIDYFPKDTNLRFKESQVRFISDKLLFEEKNPKNEVPNTITLYKYEVRNTTGKKITIPRIQYTGWPDKSVPSMEEMTVIVKEVLKYPTEVNKRPIIHCVAGSGRTMTLIVACLLFKYIQDNMHASDEKILDFLECEIKSARSQRGQHAINDRQCQFLFYWGQYLRDKKSS